MALSPIRCCLHIALAASFVACEAPGTVVGKATLHGEGSVGTQFTRGKGRVEIWAKFAGKWQGSKYSKLPILWTIDLTQGTKRLGQVVCDSEATEGTLYCGTTTNVGGIISEDCEVRLACALPFLEVGEVVVVTVTGKKKDPKRIHEIREMSLVFREL